jgi:3-oxoacyl-[acyl-carrier-protein] synthase-3
MYCGAVKEESGRLVGWREGEKDLNEVLEKGYFNLSQDVNLLGENIVPISIRRALQTVREKRGLKAESITWVLPHLSSMFFKQPLVEEMVKQGFEIPPERMFTNLSYKGNTGSASIYIILEELLTAGKIKKGDRILCCVPESARFSFAYMHLTAE